MTDQNELEALVKRIGDARFITMKALHGSRRSTNSPAGNERLESTPFRKSHIRDIKNSGINARNKIRSIVQFLHNGHGAKAAALNDIRTKEWDDWLKQQTKSSDWQELVNDLCSFADIEHPSNDEPSSGTPPDGPPVTPSSSDTDIKPKLPQLASMAIALDDQGNGNGGTHDMPDVQIQLTFGDLDAASVEDHLPHIALGNCSLEASFSEGRISEGFYGDALNFSLRWGTPDAPETMPVSFKTIIQFTSPARWVSTPGPKGRRLKGRSEVHKLCSFNERPSKLNVELKIQAYDLRVVVPESETAGRQDDAISKVIDAFIRKKIFVEQPTQEGFYILQKVVLI